MKTRTPATRADGSAERPGSELLLGSLPAASAALVQALVAAADRERVALYAVGGPVRDLVLGRPLRDVDLLLERRGEIDAEGLARATELADVEVTVHDRFGTLRVETADAVVDVATARRERYAHPGALPEVESGTLDEDLRRRDFTINALALPLSRVARAAHSGIVDVEDGLTDLDGGVLRILHPHSFHDDPTRAFRAARLGARLDLTLSRGSRTALRDALRDGVFGRVSGDRLRRELEKLFDDARQGVDPGLALRLLAEWHVLAALEPGLTLPRQTLAPLRRLGRAISTPPWPLGRARVPVAGLDVWLSPLEPGLRARTLRRFAVRGELATRIAGFAGVRDVALRGLGRARGRGAIDAVLSPLGAEEALALYAWAPPAMRRRIARHALEDRPRRAPLTGEDLVALGLAGPAIGRALARIRIAFLDGAVKDREDALTLAREMVRRRASPRRPVASGSRAPAADTDRGAPEKPKRRRGVPAAVADHARADEAPVVAAPRPEDQPRRR